MRDELIDNLKEIHCEVFDDVFWTDSMIADKLIEKGWMRLEDVVVDKEKVRKALGRSWVIASKALLKGNDNLDVPRLISEALANADILKVGE